MHITGKFIELSDSTGQLYYGIDIASNDIECFITHLRLKGINEQFISKKLHRDNGKYHITIVNTMASNKFKSDLNFQSTISQFLNTDISFEVFGIGHVETNIKDINKQAWFIVCENSDLQKSFSDLGILQDYHITIAFEPTDVFRVRKNQETIIYPMSEIQIRTNLKRTP